MKRKKWSEHEELTLLNRYSELHSSGALAKLKTREKKFKPIADHVNSVHHLQDPLSYPFKWSWRDVSIKVQNMRHQYMGVKQKIKISSNEFNWNDGENHWENFLKYKEVFGDVELSDVKDHNNVHNGFSNNGQNHGKMSRNESVMATGFQMESEEFEDEEEEEEIEVDEVGVSDGEFVGGRGEKEEEVEDSGSVRERKVRKGIGGRMLSVVGGQVLELRELMLRREERMREREWSKEEGLIESEKRKRERERIKEMRDEKRLEELEMRELELEERRISLARRELEWRLRLEKEFDDERLRRMKLEEKLEEEEMEWREKMIGMQIEHEKQMMQMHADACQNQMQVLSVMARLLCQFFGSTSDSLAGSLGTMPPQVLQNLHHSVGLGDSVKPDPNTPSEFL